MKTTSKLNASGLGDGTLNSFVIQRTPKTILLSTNVGNNLNTPMSNEIIYETELSNLNRDQDAPIRIQEAIRINSNKTQPTEISSHMLPSSSAQ